MDIQALFLTTLLFHILRTLLRRHDGLCFCSCLLLCWRHAKYFGVVPSYPWDVCTETYKSDTRHFPTGLTCYSGAFWCLHAFEVLKRMIQSLISLLYCNLHASGNIVTTSAVEPSKLVRRISGSAWPINKMLDRCSVVYSMVYLTFPALSLLRMTLQM